MYRAFSKVIAHFPEKGANCKRSENISFQKLWRAQQLLETIIFYILHRKPPGKCGKKFWKAANITPPKMLALKKKC